MVQFQGDTALTYAGPQTPMNAISLIGCGLALYAAIGLAVGVAFVVAGAVRVLPRPASFTPGARLLVLPGAAALWPYVLIRWLRAPGRT
jgi:F0F1-type ATP synthase membrane subunit c/vacuolar-type H+-ATPase subunit K